MLARLKNIRNEIQGFGAGNIITAAELFVTDETIHREVRLVAVWKFSPVSHILWSFGG